MTEEAFAGDTLDLNMGSSIPTAHFRLSLLLH